MKLDRTVRPDIPRSQRQLPPFKGGLSVPATLSGSQNQASGSLEVPDTLVFEAVDLHLKRRKPDAEPF
jgi:hypothetical protein